MRTLTDEETNVPCPVCNARINHPCKVMKGRRKGKQASVPHAARTKRWENTYIDVENKKMEKQTEPPKQYDLPMDQKPTVKYEVLLEKSLCRVLLVEVLTDGVDAGPEVREAVGNALDYLNGVTAAAVTYDKIVKGDSHYNGAVLKKRELENWKDW